MVVESLKAGAREPAFPPGWERCSCSHLLYLAKSQTGSID